MTAQLLLSTLLSVMVVFFATQPLLPRVLRVALLAGGLSGLVLIWNPDLANRIAHGVGIGRGADLMLYLWVLLSLAGLVYLRLRVHGVERSLTQLARHLALAQALADRAKASGQSTSASKKLE